MIFLNHLDPEHHKQLNVISDDWPFQFLPGYSKFQHDLYGEDILIMYDEILDAYLPLRIVHPRMIKSAQILFAPLHNAVELTPEKQSDFFNRMIQALQKWGKCDRLIQPHPYGFLSTYPSGSKFCEFGTYIIDLANQSAEEILERFHPKYQKAIAHSRKHGAVIKSGRQVLCDFYNLYESTMKRAGIEYEKPEFFEKMHDYLGENHVCMAVVYDGNEPVSGIFIIYSKYSAFLTHAGTPGESRLYGAAKFLNYEMMKRLKNIGVRRYDFVGVRLNNNNPSLEGIFKFKKGFGGMLKTGYLWKMNIHPIRAGLFNLLLKLKSGKNRTKDIIDQVTE